MNSCGVKSKGQFSIMKKTISLIVVLIIALSFPQNRGIPVLPSNLNINYGGCGYFAKYLHLKYPKSKIVNFYLARYDRIHFMLFFPETGEYADYNGFTKYPVWLIFKYRFVSESYLDSMLLTPGWNKKFNLSDTIKIKNAVINNGNYIPIVRN